MKIFILSLLISFSVVLFSNAQSFSFIDPKIQVIAPTCSGYNDFYVHMRNEKTDSLRMQWKALVNPLDSCWQFQYSMCDNFNCYLGIPGTPTTMTTIGPGDTTYLKLSNSAMTHFSGTPVVKVLVWDLDFPSSNDTITYYLTICPDSIPCEYYSMNSGDITAKNEFEIYPVPANDFINLKYPLLADSKIIISDLSGKKLLVIPASNSFSSVNISWLAKGIYFIQFAVPHKILFTHKIIKT